METTQHQCRKCGLIFSKEEYLSTLFCPNCGSHLSSQVQPRQPKHWLFQFSPKIYEWFTRLNESNENEQWLASQNSKMIRANDTVAIWSSGEKAGVYAFGLVMTNPSKKSLNANQEKFFKTKADIEKFREKPSVEVKYWRTFVDNPILQSDCHKDPTLAGMRVFLNPQGTNFALSKAEWARLKELADQRQMVET